MYFRGKIALLLIIFLLLGGCVSTVVSYPPHEDAVFRLSSLGTRTVNLIVRPGEVDPVVGHQYLIFLVPFGRIFHTAIGDSVTASAYKELSLAGIRPVVLEPGTAPVPPNTLVLEPVDLQLTAYDLFFVRRTYCRLSLKGIYFGRDGQPKRSYELGNSMGEFRAYAFKKQLEPLFRENVDQTIKILFKNLGVIA